MPIKILPVLNVHAGDAASAIATLELCHALDGQIDETLVVSHTVGFDAEHILKIATMAFKCVFALKYHPYMGDRAWPGPQNHAWQSVARQIEFEASKKLISPETAWLWWESDAVPLRKGWLAAIDAAYRKGKQPFAGVPLKDTVTSFYLNGVAVYPFELVEPLSKCAALYSRAHPFDRLAGPSIKRAGYTDISDLIEYAPKSLGGGSSGRYLNIESTQKLLADKPKAVLYHGCTDGSLQSSLRGVEPPPPPAPVADVHASPSFTEQTPWPCGIFAMPLPPSPMSVAHFNCGLIEKDGKKWLFTRRHRFFSTPPGFTLGDNQSDLVIYQIREPSMTLVTPPIIPALPVRHPFEQFEDPRAFVGRDGTVYVSFATWVQGRASWPPGQVLCRLTKDWSKLEVVAEPAFGGNVRSPSGKPEKNWTWFEHADEVGSFSTMHYVYSISPHVVVSTIAQMAQNRIPWQYGEPRGGTPPVRVGDEYISFFHSSLPWQPPKRRYFMGAYTFSAKPPFEPLRSTRAPLLIGSEQDMRSLNSPLVVFPCGALKDKDDGEWLVTFGLNDEHCAWIRIPDDALQERLVPISVTAKSATTEPLC